MEKYNLKYDDSQRKFVVPFDTKELLQYTFADTIYLGKAKICIAPNKTQVTDPKMFRQFILNKEFQSDFCNDILALLNLVVSLGTVLIN
jgi:hypothetical protein